MTELDRVDPKVLPARDDRLAFWESFLRVLLIILRVEFRLPVLPRTFFQNVG